MVGGFGDKNGANGSHKVVAMPSNSPFAVPRDGSSTSGDNGSSYLRRVRSRSAGRTPVSRSRDIVQDVYDRMGVNYIRGRPSIENLLEDNRILGTQRPGQDRASSRGRSFNSNRSDTGATVRSSWVSKNQDSKPVVLPTSGGLSYLPPNEAQKSSQKDARESEEANTEGPDDERDGISVVSVKSSKSVKDRISEYGASIRASTGGNFNVTSTGTRSSVRASYGSNFNRQSYGGQKAKEAQVPSWQAQKAAEPSVSASTFDQNSTSSVGLNKYHANNSVSHRSAKSSSLADTFLANIAKTSQFGSTAGDATIGRNIHVVEIPHNELRQSGDMASVAASSVSGDDFVPSSPVKRISTSVNRHSTPNFLRNNGNPNIEHLIEERVQAHLATLEKKLDSEINRIESRLEHEFKVRLEQLETQNHELKQLISMGRM